MVSPSCILPILLLTIAFLLLSLTPCHGIVCRKEKVSPLGLNYGVMNVECGQYVQHCLKVLMWDGTVIRDCDPLALCPRDGSKLIQAAEYFCCLGNLCNGAKWPTAKWTVMIMIPSIVFLAQIFVNEHWHALRVP